MPYDNREQPGQTERRTSSTERPSAVNGRAQAADGKAGRHPGPGEVVGEEARDLREAEYEDEVEKQLQRGGPLLDSVLVLSL
jgi:hypothetical protein